ncbi:hypothetical protein MOMA_00235 [Moraxella macacae 0408225]|uniref:Sel1 repeat family protein n=1 Tax=Moraxella macacae 0408225 TaxID=1230338 RepID=L2F8J5_9GAMM|nr:hypothetical protein [Moraxella macacae]ELA08793.1 hypothetical protein MOMA_00235 [Moraxella macacae 0408225]
MLKQSFAVALLSLSAFALSLPANAATIKKKPKTTQKATKQKATNFGKSSQPAQSLQNNPTSDLTTLDTADQDLSLSTITYPKFNAVQFVGTDLQNQTINLPRPTLKLSNISTVPTVVIPTTKQATSQIDVSVIDDFITEISPKARHYPPVFRNRTESYHAIQKIKQLSAWIDRYAKNPHASYEVLLRATKINAMARNLDLGSEYAVKASEYVTRALKINDTAEANFLYGAMLSEGGGFETGSKYLEKAEKMGFAEATQSLAQADLLNDKKERAIQRLNAFKAKYPNDPYIDEQLRLVNSGEYYIWKIPVKTVR